MIIRRAVAEDTKAVQSIARAAYQQYVAAIGTEPAPMVADFATQIDSGIVSVALVDGNILGFVVAFGRDDHFHLENVAVDPSGQGKGIGVALVRHAEAEARRAGFDAIELYTNEKMTGNLTWYPALGYEEIGRWTEGGFNRVFFRKRLDDD